MVRDKKTLLAEVNTSVKRNLISVGCCPDTPVHVDTAGNTDRNHPCLGNGQTVMMRIPDNFCRREMDAGVKKDIWSVMDDFSKAPGGKDLNKMKTQYEMFVDVVDSSQVTV
jgi:hypothetical protein